MTRFSIIIPVYNVAPYLRDCLDSVRAAVRTFEGGGGEGEPTAGVEIICVDDGSTDESGSVLDEYAANDGRFRVIHQTNRGVSAARNAALAAATGEWLMFVDGDDVLEAAALSRVDEEIRAAPEADVIRYGFYRFGGDDGCSEIQPRRVVDLSREIPSEEMDGLALITWRNVLRRRCCDGVLFADYVCGEDRLYTFECLQETARLVRMPDRLYGYRCRPLSYTTSVIKTYRGWEGELGYRMEFLQKANVSEKRIHYEGAEWLVRYLANEFLRGFMGSETLTDAEKRRLYGQWMAALSVLSGHRAFTGFQRLNFRLQKALGSYRLVQLYFHLKLKTFGPRFCLRKLYRRIRHHAEYAETTARIQLVTKESDDCHAGAKAPRDAAVIAERMGFRRFCVKRPLPPVAVLAVPYLMAWLVKSLWYFLCIPRGATVFIQFTRTAFTGRKSLLMLGWMRKLRHVRLIVLVHDVEVLRGDGFAGCRAGLDPRMRQLIAASDILIVHNPTMREWFEANGVASSRLVELGLFDYLFPSQADERSVLSNEIVLAGNLSPSKAGYLSQLRTIPGVTWKLFGPEFDESSVGGANVRYCGCYSPEELPRGLKGSFGLVWDGESVETCSGRFGAYLHYNNPHKQSLYLAAGLPVIVWNQSAWAEYVRANGIGLEVGSLRDVPAVLSALDAKAYGRMCQNVRRVADRLRTGRSLEAALRAALARLGECEHG